MELTSVLILTIIIAIVLIAILIRWVVKLKERNNELVSRKQSLSTKYGRMSEQFMPFLEDYPYDSDRFRFLGDPIDGVQFNDEEIIFMEFKTSSSRMSRRQKEIRDLVERGKVKFEEFRME
ncbi:endonuclease [Patescibacteria group bacterium]|nr:MAG: endonuclease [Patescibacteria group bacterium]